MTKPSVRSIRPPTRKRTADYDTLPASDRKMLDGLDKLINASKVQAVPGGGDYDPNKIDPFQQALQANRQQRANRAASEERVNSYFPTPQVPQEDPAAAEKINNYFAPQPPTDAEPPQLGVLQRTKNYFTNKYNEIVHAEGPGGTHLHPTDRFMSGLGLISDPIDFILGGAGTAFSANPQGGILKWGVQKPFNALGAAAGNLGRQVLNSYFGPTVNGGQSKPVDFSQVYSNLVKGYNEEANGSNFITETLRGIPATREWIDKNHGDAWTKWLDFAAGWELGPKIARPLAPVFHFAGKAVRFGTDAAARGLENAAEHVDSRPLRSAATRFKELTNSTPEYRAAQEATHAEQHQVSGARQQLARIGNISKNIGRKLQGDPNVTLYGDLLKFHPDPAIAAKANNPGYLPTQMILHGAEAGTEGAFFNHESEVLSIAADLGLPVEPLHKAIQEFRTVSGEGGRQMVTEGLMDDKVFQANADHWVKRIYRTNIHDNQARTNLIRDMTESGVDSTRANELLMALQAAGEAGPEGAGMGLSTVGNKAKSFARKLGTPEDRLEFMPEYNAFDQVANSIVGQYKAAAMHRVFKTLAGDEAMSAANKIKNIGLEQGGPLKFSQTPRIQGMLRDVTEQIKAHQARMTERLEKAYAERKKWVDEQDAAARTREKRYQQHVTSEPVKPVAPQAPVHQAVEKQSDVLNVGETAVYKPKLSGVLQGIKQEQATGAYEKANQQYVKDLASWQTKHQAWQKRTPDLAAAVRDSQAELARRQKYFDETDAEVGQWFDQAEKLQRKHDLLKGAEPTDVHANDALSAAEEKLGFEITDPQQRQQYLDSWKNAWTSRGIDIFDARNPDPAVAPKGIPQELVDKVDQNITPAIALDETLSAPEHAYSEFEHPPGWEKWVGQGNRSYGAMEGRWGPTVIKRFVEDAIDPNRFDKNSHPALEFLKILGNQFKALKLYYNPGTKYGIEVQSFWESKATVNAAGVKFNPVRYIEGMKEYKRWAEGDGPATPVVQAMLQGVRESGAGYMTAMSPEALPNVGKESAARRFANNNRQKFIEVQQFPKAGTAALLVDAGFDPATAGQMAEQGFGARGGMGGVETHGVMQIAEGLNKYGIAIFTSYPLHSVNRFFQIMAQKPEVLMTYPVIRQYLMNQAGPEARQRDDREEVRPTMVPIPGMKSPDGQPVWIDVANLIPHGGATSDIRIGGPFSPFDNPLRRANDARDRLLKQGAAPTTAEDERVRQGYFAIAPSVIGTAADSMQRALAGNTRSPFSVEAGSPLMAAGSFVGFPMQYAEDSTDRTLRQGKVADPSRVDFQQKYIDRVTSGLEKPEDYSAYVKTMDIKEAYGAQGAAQKYLANLLADKSIDSDRAKAMIRRQVDWIIAINAKIQDQTNILAATQSEENQDAAEANQYSEPG